MGVRVTLKGLRANNGLTQNDMAKRLGVAKSTWNSWENHVTYPSVLQVNKLLEEFNVSYEDIIF